MTTSQHGAEVRSLRRLPHSRVPFTAMWRSVENPHPETAIAWAPCEGWHRPCACVPGEGVADLGIQCHARQRHCMRSATCGMCGLPLPAQADFLFIGERQASFYIEPPLHEHCAAVALRTCPVLRRTADSVEVAFASSYRLWERREIGEDASGAPVFADSPLSARSPRPGVLEYLLAVPVAPRRRPAVQWLGTCPPTSPTR